MLIKTSCWIIWWAASLEAVWKHPTTLKFVINHMDMKPCFRFHLKIWSVKPFVDRNVPLKISLGLFIGLGYSQIFFSKNENILAMTMLYNNIASMV